MLATVTNERLINDQDMTSGRYQFSDKFMKQHKSWKSKLYLLMSEFVWYNTILIKLK